MESQNIESVGDESTATNEPTFEQEVNTVVSKMIQDKDGNFQLPEGDYSEQVRVAANAERRRRSTESALSKTNLKLKALETVNSKLTQQIVGKPTLNLTSEQVKELDDLKYTDPEIWRKKINEYEALASTTLQTELQDMTTEASQQAELETRKTILADFNQKNNSHELMTDEVFTSELPQRIIKELEEGKISFEGFLYKAYDYLTSPKRIGDINKVVAKPNLGIAGGGSNPSEEAFSKEAEITYQNAIL